MKIRRLPSDEAAVRRYLEALWLPYNRELEGLVEEFSLADDVDVLAEELDHRLDRLESETFRAWVAVDGFEEGDDLAGTDGEFVGFVTTERDASPPIFDRPDRLVICDLYVTGAYRGTGLARELVDRARAFYDELGFEAIRTTMVAPAAGDSPVDRESRSH